MLSHSASSNFFFVGSNFLCLFAPFFCSVSRDCSTKCSFHGHCDKDQNCICDKGWAGPTCNMQTCIEECIHGYCDNTTGLCVCDPGVYGKMLCLRPCSNFSCNDNYTVRPLIQMLDVISQIQFIPVIYSDLQC